MKMNELREFSIIVDDETPVEVDPDEISTFTGWTPIQGDYFSNLLLRNQQDFERFSSEPKKALERWAAETQRIAGRCVNPEAIDGMRLESRQLIVGRVQSGKTSNFTGVIARLADNGYKFFVILGGTTKPLLQQTTERLKKDLGEDYFQFFSTEDDTSQWSESAAQIRDFIKASADNQNPHSAPPKKPLVLTVLKWNQGHLDVVKELLSGLNKDSETLDFMRNFPIALIDDECDTFTPNSKLNNDFEEASAIYGALLGLKESVNVCSYLGYTATPMAQEVQTIEDALKPERVTVLEQGIDYLGAEHLFSPDSNYPETVFDWNGTDPLPVSLKEAFGNFLVSSVIFHHEDQGLRAKFVTPPALENSFRDACSMLVHVDRTVDITTQTYVALRNLRSDWIAQLSMRPLPDGTLENQTRVVLENFLEPAAKRLGVEDQLSGSDLVSRAVGELREMGVKLIVGDGNEGYVEFPSSSELKKHMNWLFVGAQLLDRGQTLPNLLVTYLARRSGGGARGKEAGGNVDTLLQRGRFFGYRKQYEPLLRGYFDQTSRESFQSIISIESKMREKLKIADFEDLPFGLIPAIFELDPEAPKLSYTRKSVIPRKLQSMSWLPGQWMLNNAPFGVEASPKNADLVIRSIGRWTSGKSEIWDQEDLFLPLPIDEALNFYQSWTIHDLNKYQYDLVWKILNFCASQNRFDQVDFRFRKRRHLPLDSLETSWIRRFDGPRERVYENKQGNNSTPDRDLFSLTHPTFQVKFFQFIDSNSGKICFQPAPSLTVNLGPAARYMIEGNGP